jgi:hypothetical protein
MHVFGTGDRAQNGRFHTFQLETLAGVEGRPAVGELDDNGRVDLFGRLEYRVDRVGTDHIDSGQGEAIGLSHGKQVLHALAGYDTR